jgi:hypothetical protein
MALIRVRAQRSVASSRIGAFRIGRRSRRKRPRSDIQIFSRFEKLGAMFLCFLSFVLVTDVLRGLR